MTLPKAHDVRFHTKHFLHSGALLNRAVNDLKNMASNLCCSLVFGRQLVVNLSVSKLDMSTAILAGATKHFNLQEKVCRHCFGTQISRFVIIIIVISHMRSTAGQRPLSH